MKKPQAGIAKLILSNRSMKDGTLSFSYVNPFDVLVNLTGGQVWWRKRDLQPNSLLQFPADIVNRLPEILSTYSTQNLELGPKPSHWAGRKPLLYMEKKRDPKSNEEKNPKTARLNG